MNIIIENAGGNCPVQIEGTINGRNFYFRARWSSWSLSVADDNGDVFSDSAWFYREPYPGEVGSAGWMPMKEAEAFLHKAAKIYVNSLL